MGITPDITTDFTLNVFKNKAPTAMALENPVNNIAENSDTTNRIKLADIAISDDGLGTNNISLTGADVPSFEVEGSELFLRAGTNLDFETKDSYSVTVEVDDSEVGATPDLTTDFTLNLTDVEPEGKILDDLLFRFHNSNKPGTYLFAGHQESENIHANYPNLVEEGEAFSVSSQEVDALMCFNRFRHSDNNGYLFAGEEESITVRRDYPGFIEEGMAFYAFGADAGLVTV